jgi:hypothetical protein
LTAAPGTAEGQCAAKGGLAIGGSHEATDQDKPRWPFGYRILLWLVGSIAVIVVITAITFLLNQPR